MTGLAGTHFGLIGALAAFPRRLAAREVKRLHGHLLRGTTRATTHLVFGRTLLAKLDGPDIAMRAARERATSRVLLSENAFLQQLGLITVPETANLSRQALVEQSRLSVENVDLLSLFDAFEHPNEPFSFKDVILARKYAGLISGGASWDAIARSVHRFGPVGSLTAKSLHIERGEAIYLRHGESLSELDGQLLFELGASGDDDLEEWFSAAETAEAEGNFGDAADLYQRCIDLDPADAVAAFNRANCLRQSGRMAEAASDYHRAIKRDPAFVESWFNLAGLMTESEKSASARRYLEKAIALDKTYADAVFNLAGLEFDAGNLVAARSNWVRYLELDSNSDWARTAARGIQFVDLQIAQRTAG
ncbi:tetratricopeptide repeat protein [Mesorhizobium sp. NBSH29]|uniref:tetratricopeptide repeat protein n=1 Tax=Mesorhizobium sp. NBSH29 TaxID=2654249 RepID=UPI00189676BF|nr:tetratricopeptide repeat protein [Mesorhizobium sp. NBSH29]QPC86623.1 tetratricopeptide repeat protein [Mesorhizobium sp. NBSH29]